MLAGHRANAGSADTVRDFVDAYNRHDVDQAMSFLAEDARWLSIDGETLVTEASGRKELAAGLRAYFASLPSARSVIRDLQTNGNFVSVVEEAQWTSDGEERRQCALAIYEIDRDVIKRVWYFATQSCAAAP